MRRNVSIFLALSLLSLQWVWGDVPSSKVSLYDCVKSFQESAADRLQFLTENDPNHPSVSTWALYQQVAKKNDQELKRVFPSPAVLQLLANAEQLSLINRLAAILKKIKAEPDAKKWFDLARVKLKENLKADPIILPRTLTARIQKLGTLQRLRANQLEALEYMLGSVSLEEMQELTYGKSIEHVSKNSLVGRYISLTGAATLLQDFSTNTRENSQSRGPKRLVIAVSRSSFSRFQKIFLNEHLAWNYLMHSHTPQQGTLMAVAGGHVYHWYSSRPVINSYDATTGVTHTEFQGEYSNPFRFSEVGTLLPTVLLSTSEGARMRQFFDLLVRNVDLARHPWMIPAEKKEEFSAYCATGGYESCTQWLMNMPLGDELVSRYTFPGAVDEYADNIDTGVQTQRLQRIRKDFGFSHEDNVSDGVVNAETAALVRRVWKAPWGNAPLWKMLDLYRQQIRAELVNPGWLVIALLSRPPVERIPIVFLMVGDHRQPIPKDFSLHTAPY